jgi:hypothetical protein
MSIIIPKLTRIHRCRGWKGGVCFTLHRPSVSHGKRTEEQAPYIERSLEFYSRRFSSINNPPSVETQG